MQHTRSQSQATSDVNQSLSVQGLALMLTAFATFDCPLPAKATAAVHECLCDSTADMDAQVLLRTFG